MRLIRVNNPGSTRINTKKPCLMICSCPITKAFNKIESLKKKEIILIFRMVSYQ